VYWLGDGLDDLGFGSQQGQESYRKRLYGLWTPPDLIQWFFLLAKSAGT
jgi:hypothetical protein